MHQGAGNWSPALRVVGANHDQVDWNAQCAQRFTKPHELSTATVHLRLYYEQIEIGARPGIPSCMGAKEDDMSIRGRLGEATTSLSDQALVVGHEVKLADGRDGSTRWI